MANPFTLETLVDFPDDALSTPLTITPAHIDSLMVTLKARGIGRVIWAYYGDGHGGWFGPMGIERLAHGGVIADDQNFWGANARTYLTLGNPLRVTVEAAHRHGIEVYAYFKPYETGPAASFPEGSPEGIEWGRVPHLGGYYTWLDPFVAANQHLRIKRRTDDLWPGHDAATISTIKLTKKDAAPTRIKASNIEVWTSGLNRGYRRSDVKFAFSETVESSPREVRDVYGNVVTKQGDPVRVLTLSGLHLDDRFIAVTTDFVDGEPDFENAWDRLVTCFDARGREIPGSIATGTAIWFPELERFPEAGMQYDTGRGPEVVALDVPRDAARHAGPRSNAHRAAEQTKVRGVIGFTRGRNLYLSGAMCETEPEVRAYWMRSLAEILEAGVDGVEFRVENHSCHSDSPEDYGFNPAVMAEVRDHQNPLPEITAIRTEAYTDFLRDAKREIARRGRKMRVNLNVDWFRPAHERPGSRRLAYPANIEFDWRKWIDEGLLDEAVLRVFAKPLDGVWGGDATAIEMVRRCNDRRIPISVNRYVWMNERLSEEFERVRADGRFAGFVLYETWSYTKIDERGWTVADAVHDAELGGRNSTWKARIRTAQLVEAVCDKWKSVGEA